MAFLGFFLAVHSLNGESADFILSREPLLKRIAQKLAKVLSSPECFGLGLKDFSIINKDDSSSRSLMIEDSMERPLSS